MKVDFIQKLAVLGLLEVMLGLSSASEYPKLILPGDYFLMEALDRELRQDPTWW